MHTPGIGKYFWASSKNHLGTRLLYDILRVPKYGFLYIEFGILKST